mgnify:CR=1 FL=1
MGPQGRMTDKQRTMVAELSKQYKKTGRAFRIVKSLDELLCVDLHGGGAGATGQAVFMDATLPTETDEGCRLDAQESQQRNTELFSYAPDERDLRRNQRDDSSGEAQGKRFSYL